MGAVNNIDFQLFPILVRCIEQFLTKKQLLDIHDYCLNRPTTHHGLLSGKGSSSYDGVTDFLTELSANLESCKTIKSDIEEAITQFCGEIGLSSVVLTNSWFNVQDEGSALSMHTHPMSVLSGALYVNADQNSSPFAIENPNTYLKYCGIWANRCNPYSAEFAVIRPKVGSLLLFPSYLSHGSNNAANQTKKRIVISFNTRH